MNEEIKLCGAEAKWSGKPCRNRAMDNGRCKYHGGRDIDDPRLDPRNPRNVPGRPVVTGKYSKYLKNQLSDRISNYLEDKEFLSLKDEIATIRAMLSRVLEHMDAEEMEVVIDGKVLNHAKPIETIDSVLQLTDSLRKLAQTYSTIEMSRKFAMTPDEVIRILRNVTDIITKHVSDPDVLHNIKEDISKIKVE